MEAGRTSEKTRRIAIRHRGRGAQVSIYLGKMLRMFIYQNDWKVIPMSALIAGLVAMVVRKRFFLNMEGTLMGAFALVCVCIWNGCFNSIQVICRERDVIKREHRSGMHISSYIFSHMVYQALLCLAQTAVTLFVSASVGVQYPSEGLVTPLFMVDFAISLFLITYAADMMSLWVSTLAKTTTAAMTIMPFVLIFQLVFSGGMLTLPEWSKTLTKFTISNPGLKVLAAQADTNNKPYATISSMIARMRDSEIGGTVTVGQVLDVITRDDNPVIADLRGRKVGKNTTVGELKEMLDQSASFAALRQKELVDGVTLDNLLNVLHADDLVKQFADVKIDAEFTVGQLVDLAAEIPDVQANRDREITVKTTVGRLMDIVGEDRVKTFLEEKAAAVSYVEDYEYRMDNVIGYWMNLILFVLAFAALATITLEFIDKDKR